ncbi:MFS transporter [Leucobacter sp. USHLN153]|uniref:MFS transporter n=1 Tax=Leucobacter sp. USHLN153 TaxID=3081268 RepID=UPI003017EB4E
MLAIGVAAQAAGTLLVSTPAYLIVLLHTQQGVSLTQGGLLASAPTFGMVLTLVAWGAAADRWGERGVIATGSALSALAALAAAFTNDFVWLAALLAAGGAAAASTNAASGRVVVGWFPRHRRGLAMGIRQMSQPLGVAAAALIVPPMAAAYGVAAPLFIVAAATGVLAIAALLGIENPPRSAPAAAGGTSLAPTANPYRRDGFLARIHVLSVLLVVPQFTLSIFGIVWLSVGLGWSEAWAGAVIAAAQFIGALGRIGVGHLSDRVGSRVRVLRWVALAGVAAMVALAASAALHWDALAAVLFIVATTISVADNGLAFTSVAEAAGPGWSGRALGLQNTGQFIAASAVGPGIGALVTLAGFPLALAAVALAPLISIPLIPARDRDSSSE